MDKIIIPGAEPFFLPAGKTGCLLVHGFTGTPKEMRLMGNFLHDRGITVNAIRLAGHGTHIDHMIRMRWQDWLASVEDGLSLLRDYCDRVFIAGLSMGGVLSLLSASIFPLNGAIAMAAPFELRSDWRLKIARPLSVILPVIDKGGSHASEEKGTERHIEYHGYPTRSVVELISLIDITKENLENINIPLLLINSRSDPSVPAIHQQKYEHLLKDKDVRSLMLQKSGHAITEDIEREIVFDTALEFIHART